MTEYSNGGQVKSASDLDTIPVLLTSGVIYVSPETAAKYSEWMLRAINGGNSEVVVVEKAAK